MRLIKDKRTLDKAPILLMLLLLLVTPELLTIAYTRSELLMDVWSFLNSSKQLFSLTYLPRVGSQNVVFLLGLIKEYPVVFLPEMTIFAIAGILFLALSKKQKSQSTLLLLLCLFFGYFVFYGVYAFGSALMGGGSRFLLILYPPLSILAAFGIVGLSEWLFSLGNTRTRKNVKSGVHGYALCTAITVVFFVIPFVYTMPFLAHPNYSYADFPIVPNAQQKDPYAMMYANSSLAFITHNYTLVPADCLVFSPSPYLWYLLNRSSADVFEYNASSLNLKNYSCFVLDYSWFCGNPFNNTACNAIVSKYKLKVLSNRARRHRFELHPLSDAQLFANLMLWEYVGRRELSSNFYSLFMSSLTLFRIPKVLVI